MGRATRLPARRFTAVSLAAALCVALLWPASAPAAGITWTDQFGTRYPDEADGVAIDPDGNLYVAGQTSGELPGQKAAGMIDTSVRRSDGSGHEVWTRQFGSNERDEPKGLTLDDV